MYMAKIASLLVQAAVLVMLSNAHCTKCYALAHHLAENNVSGA